MKKVAVLGAGFVTKPAVDYFLDTCGYQVTVTSPNIGEAEKLIGRRSGGKALCWTAGQDDVLDAIVRDADLVLSMIPPNLHLEVAKMCLKHGKSMVTTSYISPEMERLDNQCREDGIIILNEIGEDPGLDNMNTARMIDQVEAEKGEVVSVNSYGAGLPAFEHNNNPFGYKFSWSPHGLILATQADAAYLKSGKRVDVTADELFCHYWLVDLENIGTFETYPNRDAEQYRKYFKLGPEVSLYRGLLRFSGWCDTMHCFRLLGLFNVRETKKFSGMSYADFMASLIGKSKGNLVEQIADHLGRGMNSSCIKKMQWLGLLDDTPVRIASGSNGDVLVDAMQQKLSYATGERDMVIIYTELCAEFNGYRDPQ